MGVKALDAAGNACAGRYEQADCLTLKLNFSKPAPYFHTIMGIWVAYPAKEELIFRGRRELVEQLQVSRSATAPSS